MSSTVVQEKVKFAAVDLDTIRLDTVKNFDLYLRVEEDKYVLYLASDNVLTDTDISKLAEKQVKRLYISSEDEDNYKQYVEEHLPEIVADPNVSADTKSRIVYDSASHVVEEVFREPRTETIQRSKGVIGATVTLIISDVQAARKLMQLTSHDYYTYTHSVNVCVFGVALANKLFPGMSNGEIQRLGAGFALHDIGKSRIPISVLQKEGPLDENEWILMKKHPEYSAEILEETGHLTDEAKAVALQHHERVDGTGYPSGLMSANIHEFAKICMIADIFDALTTNRSYREAMRTFDALNLMKSEMEAHFHQDYFR
ncbi:MAG: HD domain-containing protein, partial [Candidatus Hydrogenedentes bacterium]|nr:HD domain-containing protein [Candidatus Hydrogenedentota bacterium]